MIYLIIAGMFVLFIVFAFLRRMISNTLGIKLCSICAAVFTTWIVLIALKLYGIEIDTLVIGILIGETLMSLMYIFENKAIAKGKNNLLWLKIIIVILGTLLTYLGLSEGFTLRFDIYLIISLILLVIILLKLKSKNKKLHDRHNMFSDEIKKLEEKLEHCCD